MEESLPDLYLVRHGETSWSLFGQHTGLTDLPLTPDGEEQARRLLPRLAGINFAKVLSSPLQRGVRTCGLAGYGSAMEINPDLVEWNHGNYEIKTRPQILAQRPDWIIFRDGCPNGESPNEIATRIERALARIREVNGNVLVFSSGHFLRVLMARWLGLKVSGGGYSSSERPH